MVCNEELQESYEEVEDLFSSESKTKASVATSHSVHENLFKKYWELIRRNKKLSGALEEVKGRPICGRNRQRLVLELRRLWVPYKSRQTVRYASSSIYTPYTGTWNFSSVPVPPSFATRKNA
jgi:hypothetical protein